MKRKKQAKLLRKDVCFVISCFMTLSLYMTISIWSVHSKLKLHSSTVVFNKRIMNENPVLISPQPKLRMSRNQTIETTSLHPLKSKEWSHPIIHIVTSRFMQGQADLIHLTKARLELFEAICMPSMIGQDLMDEYIFEQLFFDRYFQSPT